MKFGHELEQERHKLNTCLAGEGKAVAFVLYKDLKKKLNRTTREYGDVLAARKSTSCDDECSVCLEPFSVLSHGFQTTCGHWFHPMCFVDAVTEQSKCPLCRRSLRDILPQGFDSVALGFAARVRIQADEIEACYVKIFKTVKSEIDILSIQAKSSKYNSIYTLFGGKRWLYHNLKQVNDLIDKVLLMVEYVRINLTAFRKICKKFDKNLGSITGHFVAERLCQRCFFRDTSDEGNGKVHALYQVLVGLGESIVRSINSHALPSRAITFNPRPFEATRRTMIEVDTSGGQHQDEDFHDLQGAYQAFLDTARESMVCVRELRDATHEDLEEFEEQSSMSSPNPYSSLRAAIMAST